MADRAVSAKRKGHSRATSKPTVQVMTVDDHPIVRQGLRQLINSEQDMQVCCELEDARSAMTAVKQNEPDVAVIDLSLKDLGGLELIKQLHVSHPKLRIVVMSMHDEKVYAERALRAGAHGYLMKQEGAERVIDAIRSVLQDEIYVSERMASRMLGKYLGSRQQIQPMSPVERLSDREIEIFELLGRGLGTRQIAERLCTSIKTVESHREHIKEKLELESASELFQHATQWMLNESSS